MPWISDHDQISIVLMLEEYLVEQNSILEAIYADILGDSELNLTKDEVLKS